MLTIAVYAAVAHFQFVTWDDGNYIRIEPVRSGLTWRGVEWAFTTGETANWHPLTWLSHMLDVEIYGDQAGGHHITNLIFHVANVLLLFGVFVRMTGAIGRSAFVAALFAVHPLHVESVAWVAERKDVLSTFFALLTIWAYITYVRGPKASRYLVVCVCYALGLMAKPMLVTLPFVLLLIDVWPLGRVKELSGLPGLFGLHGLSKWRTLAVEKVPLVGLAIASSITTVLLQRQAGAMGDATPDAFPMSLRLANAVVSYAVYLGQAVWPAGLSAFYPYPRTVSLLAVVVSMVLLAGLSFLAVRAFRARPYVLVGWLWYVGMLVPVIGLVQVGQQSHADRYTYLPLVGIFLVVAWGVPDLVTRWRLQRLVLPIAASLVVLAFAVATWLQVDTWRDSFALWTHALAVTSDNDRAYNGLGAELGNRGKIDDAIVKFREAIRINPSFADAHVNLAVALSVQGKFAEALPHYAEALRLQPGHREARNHYAEALEGVGRLDEAARQYRLSLQMDPSQPDALAGLGLVLAQQGQLSEALETERNAVRLAPNSVKALYGLGAVLAVSHQVDEAIRVFNEVLRLDPGNQAARQALAQIKK